LTIDWSALRPVLQFSQFIAWTGLVVQVTERLFLMLAGYLYGIAAAGQWAVASRLVETVTTVLSQLIYHVGLAHMSPLRQMPARLAEVATLNRDLLVLVMLPGLVAVAAAAEPLVLLLFGDGWDAVAGLIAWMLLGALFVMRRLFAQVALNVTGRSAVTLQAFAAEGAVAIVMLMLLSPFGVIGAAAARGLSFAVGWLVIFRAARGTLDLPLRRESLSLAIDLAVAIASIAATHLLLADATFASTAIAFMARAALAGALALAALVACRLALLRTLVALLTAARQGR
jgi:O-antigen/teichoic acid export membrane protein